MDLDKEIIVIGNKENKCKIGIKNKKGEFKRIGNKVLKDRFKVLYTNMGINREYKKEVKEIIFRRMNYKWNDRLDIITDKGIKNYEKYRVIKGKRYFQKYNRRK